ncbi:MAG: 50S ribosomal protein L3 [Caldithrix sp.]|nr:50S ribosomal protein L3 [Caldithrix sp.]
MAGILGKKIGMSQVFDADGVVIPVTVIKAGPCVVTQVKKADSDGYDAVQLGYGQVKEKRVNNPLKGHYKKANVTPQRHLKEFDFSDLENVKPGDEIKVDIFEENTTVKISGLSKGKGFQGVMKRHGFSGAQKTHGQSDRWRAPGSIGHSSDPSRVFKGKKMAGRTGFERITIKNVQIVKVDSENNLLLVKGSVPGARNSLLEIRKS